jgi:hypothetical protein
MQLPVQSRRRNPANTGRNEIFLMSCMVNARCIYLVHAGSCSHTRMQTGKLGCTSLEGIQLFLVEVIDLADFNAWCFSCISMF